MWKTAHRSSCIWPRSGRPADTAEGRRWSAPLTAELPAKLWSHSKKKTTYVVFSHYQIHNRKYTDASLQKFSTISFCISSPLMLLQTLHHSASLPTLKNWTASRSGLWKELRLIMPSVCMWAAASSLPSDVKLVLSDHPSEKQLSPKDWLWEEELPKRIRLIFFLCLRKEEGESEI